MSDRYAITGANGNLGVRAIATLGVSRVRALVRSPRAKETLLEKFPTLEVFVVDYTDADSLRIALDGCDVVVHLVGIIKETQFSRYNDAHERSCEALKQGLPVSIRHIVYLSIVGSAADSGNSCLASKGRAEDILLDSGVAVSILQVPMVLGEGDFASSALKKNSKKRFALAFRAESLEQPIYAADVIDAICAAANAEGGGRFQLAGPESLSRRSLIQRAAHLQGRAVIVLSLPISLGMMMAWVFEFLPNPPVTRAMLGVLDHDDQIDSQESLEKLGLTLTPLNKTLSKILQLLN
jgi:uncharacterized protein YbjT (DUF2867 family)